LPRRAPTGRCCFIGIVFAVRNSAFKRASNSGTRRFMIRIKLEQPMSPNLKRTGLLISIVWCASLATQAQMPESVDKSQSAAVGAAASQGRDQKSQQAKTEQPTDPIVAALLSAHNLERKKSDHGPLKYSAKLSAAALAHAKDMAEHH